MPSIRPLQQRLLVPLGLVLLLLVTGFVGSLLLVHKFHLDKESREELDAVRLQWDQELQRESRLLEAIGNTLQADSSLQDALQGGARDQLRRHYQPVYERLRQAYGITHFYFHRPDGTNLLRLHQPQRHDDVIRRQTLQAARRSGRPAAGLELGPLGTFTLRRVQPIRADGHLLGFLELGKEIEILLEAFRESRDFEVVLYLDRQALAAAGWEPNPGSEPAAGPDEPLRVSYSTLSRPAPELAGLYRQAGIRQGQPNRGEIRFAGRNWLLLSTPLQDARGKAVADLVLLRDFTATQAAFLQLLGVAAGGGVLLLGLLGGLLGFGLRRLDDRLRQQQAALAENEERLDLALSVANDGLWDWHLDTGTVYFDARYYTMAGYAPDAFPGNFEEWVRRLHPEDRDVTRRSVEAYLAGEQDDYDVEFRFRRADGDYMWIRARGEIVSRDRGGRPRRFIGTHADITERKQAEQVLQESRTRLAEAQRIAHIGNWELDPESDALYWSDEVFRIFEIDPGQFGARYEDFLARVHPEDRELVDRAYQDSLTSRQPYDIVHRLQFGDGRLKYVHERCETEFDAEGRPRLSRGTVQDVTGLQQAERQLQHRLELEAALSRASGCLAGAGEQGTDMDSAIRAALSHFGQAIHADHGGLYRLDEAATTLHPGQAWHAEGRASQPTRESPLERAVYPELFARLEKGELINLGLADTASEQLAPLQALMADSGMRWLVLVPLGSETGLRGMLGFGSEQEAVNWQEQDLAELQTLAGILAGSLTRFAATQELQEHARFLENLDRVNRLLSANRPAEDVLRQLTEVLLDIYDADRAWLISLSDPRAPTYPVPIEATRPEYPGAFAEGAEIPTDEFTARLLHHFASTPEPLCMHVADLPRAPDYLLRYQIQSQMLIRLEPKHGPPWLLGLHQCRWQRDWSELEQQLFRTIAERVTLTLSDANLLQQLRENEARLEEQVATRTATVREQAQIIEQTHESVVTTDLDGQITSWNQGAERLFGVPAREALGRHIRFVYPPDQRRSLEQQLIAPLRASGAHDSEVRLQRADGEVFPAHLYLSLIHDAEGAPRGIMGFAVDISELKQRERDLEQTANRLQETNAELESFAYSVSHDLRAPLRAIDGFSQALAEDYAERLDATALDYLQRVRNGAQRMGQLIDDLLKLSRVNRTELRNSPVNLSRLAATLIEELQETETDRAVEVVLEPELQVEGDSRLLRIMLDNLLGNAWKFTRREPRARIRFGRLATDTNVFYVADNGVGFEMRHADKLFGAFQRLHRQSDFPGTGIGLATVQRIVRRHGGRVWAESRPGAGATIYFTLGSAADPAVSATPSEATRK